MDARQNAIEEMREKMTRWAVWGMLHHRRYKGNTQIIIEWIEQHSKHLATEEVQTKYDQMVQKIWTKENEAEAWKVEFLLCDRNRWGYHQNDRRVLLVYFRLPPSIPIGKIARRLDCKPWEVKETVDNALFFMSKIWRY